MTRIVHLSDTHFGTEIPDVVRALKQAIAELEPNIVLLTGDITQRARQGEFQAAKDFLDQLPVQTKLVIPGNHDIPLFNVFARLLTPYAAYQRAFGDREFTWCGDGVGIIGFNTTSRFRHTTGLLNPDYLTRRIHDIREKIGVDALLIACVHQPLSTAWPEDHGNVLLQSEAIAHAFSALKVDVVLSGHVHVPLMTSTHAVFPTLGRHFLLAGAGTAVSHRTRPNAPNSFNVITANTATEGVPTMMLTRFDFDAGVGKFIASATMQGICQDGGWQLRPL
ncbi:MAG: metallophosphoesterase [Agitococcus sp.]|nr:metallophosphoesterase [Agitococcus sp.]